MMKCPSWSTIPDWKSGQGPPLQLQTDIWAPLMLTLMLQTSHLFYLTMMALSTPSMVGRVSPHLTPLGMFFRGKGPSPDSVRRIWNRERYSLHITGVGELEVSVSNCQMDSTRLRR